MSKRIVEIDHYLEEGCGRCPLGGTPDCKVHSWTTALKKLRSIVLETGLNEELKWSVPCYTYKGNNILIVSAFKNYASVSFFKGALLKDTDNWLVKPGKNSQAARYLKFTDLSQITAKEEDIKAYIFEAIEIEKAGLKVEFKKNPEPMPQELIDRLELDSKLKAAFEALTPGKQRGYILHFSQPKQSQTRQSRIEKCVPKILKGRGFHDR
ncbi:YdeI/OmpD-associated family protein [Roseivirga sp.]|uniref:YdeI/OmpD-associated family protein n=1 Tax=Roseivirga sp. TaxID=1964215 RepID=UPI003B51FDC2